MDWLQRKKRQFGKLVPIRLGIRTLLRFTLLITTYILRSHYPNILTLRYLLASLFAFLLPLQSAPPPTAFLFPAILSMTSRTFVGLFSSCGVCLARKLSHSSATSKAFSASLPILVVILRTVGPGPADFLIGVTCSVSGVESGVSSSPSSEMSL
jgi:hypothetical protein